ncbi:MAG TPA: 5-oxoprolinase subunit PxpA [Thermomicrobiales bacterium]|nr:5-oxoprolinase subunit PxpA [Thermomicrobiales bacterium]
MRAIDLNSDLGEAFGAHRIGYDDELFDLISSANVACGFHGGDPRVMERTVAACATRGIGVGAHPSFPDLVGFGRRDIAATPDEIRADTLYQIGALAAFCRAAGVPMQHVKAHGALYNRAIKEGAASEAIAAAVAAYDPGLVMLAQPGSRLFAAAEAAGLPTAREGFVDRAYNTDGTLVNRRLPGAVITDPDSAAERALRLVVDGKLTAIDGTELTLAVDSLCIHSDTPGAVAIARAVRQRFAQAGIAIRPFGRRS